MTRANRSNEDWNAALRGAMREEEEEIDDDPADGACLTNASADMELLFFLSRFCF